MFNSVKVGKLCSYSEGSIPTSYGKCLIQFFSHKNGCFLIAKKSLVLQDKKLNCGGFVACEKWVRSFLFVYDLAFFRSILYNIISRTVSLNLELL